MASDERAEEVRQAIERWAQERIESAVPPESLATEVEVERGFKAHVAHVPEGGEYPSGAHPTEFRYMVTVRVTPPAPLQINKIDAALRGGEADLASRLGNCGTFGPDIEPERPRGGGTHALDLRAACELSERRGVVNLNETLAELVGLVGREVDVTVCTADRQQTVAGFGGELRRAADIFEELRAKYESWQDVTESLMFEVGEQRAGFFLDADRFEGAEWTDPPNRHLEIRLGDVVLMIDPWPSGAE